jgi:23S rRNA (cytosine1962-C5)-methyltransferase
LFDKNVQLFTCSPLISGSVLESLFFEWKILQKKLQLCAMQIKKWTNLGFDDYALIDAGNGQKLERWGNVHTIRPEVQAYFQPAYSSTQWQQKNQLQFIEERQQSGKWMGEPKSWMIAYKNIQVQLKCTQFKHLGIFPEQSVNWQFLEENLGPGKRFLNLFAYTGMASLVARSVGAEVVHVDSVKHLITWAKENMELSGLDGIKWVHEDALKFAQRELKRGNLYDGIVMDPPAWGIGAKGEKWKIEDKLPDLLEIASKLLQKKGFLILNTYSPRVNFETLNVLSQRFFSDAKIELGELYTQSTSKKKLFHGHLLRIIC